MSGERTQRLISEYLDRAQVPADRARLLAELKSNPVALAEFVRDADMHAELSYLAKERRAVARLRRVRPAPVPFPFGRVLAAGAAAVVLIAGAWWMTHRAAPAPPAGPICARLSAAGRIELRRLGLTRTATGTFELQWGDTLRVVSGRVAQLAFLDNSARLELDAGATVTLRDEGGKRVALHGGALSASVAAQPTGRPMMFITPEAEAQVLGTRLQLETAAGRTRLAVSEGSVRLTRLADRASVTVAAGQSAVVARGEPFEVRSTRLQAESAHAAQGLVALYTFEEAHGTLVRDRSGFRAPLHLQIDDANAVRWEPGCLAVIRSARIRSATAADKITGACAASGELTVEVWIQPAARRAPMLSAWGPSRVVTLSGGLYSRSFTLGHGGNVARLGVYAFRVATSAQPEGEPANWATVREVAQTRPTHVVYSRAADGFFALYVDGEPVGMRRATKYDETRNLPAELPQRIGGHLADWHEGHYLALANEPLLQQGVDPADSGDRAWLGRYYGVAIYCRAMSRAQVAARFRAGRAGFARVARNGSGASL
ncbi:MAG: FecR domain-containing protein [Kiritimatiellae bacterium]|nr:FecR domain-containing protein [Kiritimatiellia bacterium]